MANNCLFNLIIFDNQTTVRAASSATVSTKYNSGKWEKKIIKRLTVRR